MINRIVDCYLSSLKSKGITFDEDFVNSEVDRVTRLLNNTNISNKVYIDDYININKLSI